MGRTQYAAGAVSRLAVLLASAAVAAAQSMTCRDDFALLASDDSVGEGLQAYLDGVSLQCWCPPHPLPPPPVLGR